MTFRFSLSASEILPFNREDVTRQAGRRLSSQTLQQLSMTTSPPVRSTQPSPQACRVAVEDRSAGFAHATELGAPTIALALLKQRTTNTSARARGAEQPRTHGAFANRA